MTSLYKRSKAYHAGRVPGTIMQYELTAALNPCDPVDLSDQTVIPVWQSLEGAGCSHVWGRADRPALKPRAFLDLVKAYRAQGLIAVLKGGAGLDAKGFLEKSLRPVESLYLARVHSVLEGMSRSPIFKLENFWTPGLAEKDAFFFATLATLQSETIRLYSLPSLK